MKQWQAGDRVRYPVDHMKVGTKAPGPYTGTVVGPALAATHVIVELDEPYVYEAVVSQTQNIPERRVARLIVEAAALERAE